MSKSRPNLPDFTDPPVIEVALAVQFDRLTELRTPHLGLLWAEFRDQFLRTEEYPPRELMMETFGVPSPSKISVQLETTPPVPRIWFLNQMGTELIQVQQDAFVHNWRKVGAGERYPRYEYIREKFSAELDKFQKFLIREHLGKLVPNQCEVTYVNHILSGKGWERHGQIGQVLTVWTPRYSDSFLSEPEDVRFAIRYVIPDNTGNPLGRLHISAQPAYQTVDHKPVINLKITARGRPEGEDIESILRFLDTGREWIVRSFASITSQRLHEIWGRCNER